MPTRAPRIFVADDQRDVLESLRLLLKNEGYAAETFANPDVVISALRERTADAVLRDLNYTRDTTSGDEGLDELSLAGGNEVAEVRGTDVRMKRVEASRAGLAHSNVDEIRGGDPQYNAEALRNLLQGERGPYRDAVLFNAAGALLVAGEVWNWAQGAEEAAEAIDKGLAKALLDCWIAHTR